MRTLLELASQPYYGKLIGVAAAFLLVGPYALGSIAWTAWKRRHHRKPGFHPQRHHYEDTH